MLAQVCYAEQYVFSIIPYQIIYISLLLKLIPIIELLIFLISCALYIPASLYIFLNLFFFQIH